MTNKENENNTIEIIDNKNKDLENKDLDNKDLDNIDPEDKDSKNEDLDNKDPEDKDSKNEDLDNKDPEEDNSEEPKLEDLVVGEPAEDEPAEDEHKDAPKKKDSGKAFDIGQIVVIVALLGVCLFGAYKLYQNMTAVRLTRALALAQNAQNNGDYASAIKYYEQAIGIDSKSVIAYEELANCYATLDDTENVMNVLYSGWQNIGDQSMLDNYISLKLNTVIATIQTSGGSFDAVSDVLDVLKIDGDNEDALQLLGTLYSYCMIDKNSSGDSVLLWDTDDENSVFNAYLESVSTMLDVYEVSPSDELEMLIARYIIPEGNVVWIGLDNCSDYALLVEDAKNLLGDSSSLESFIGCLEDAIKVSAVFDGIWSSVDGDDVEAFRDFMISEDVISLKQSLIDGEDSYLEIEMENAFCQEGIVLTLDDNTWTYHFPDFSENQDTEGVITLLLTYEEVQSAKQAIEANAVAIDEEETEEATTDIENEMAFEDADSEDAGTAATDIEDSDAEDTDIENADAEDTDTQEEIKVGSISMNYEPTVEGGNYFPHTTYYFTCDYEGDLVNYTYQQVITNEDGTKTRTTISNWGDEELETIVDEEVSEEETSASDTTAASWVAPVEDSVDTDNSSDAIVDPETGIMIDPNTGLQIDPATGFLIDPATGLYIDPNTWTYIDPATGAVVDPNATQTDETQTDTTTDPNAAAAAGA